MSAEATLLRGSDDIRLTAAAAVAGGEVYQMPDGRAGFADRLNAAALGDRVQFSTTGCITLPKAAGVLLDGGRAYWDHSANVITYLKVNDRDFYVGRIVGDCATGDANCVVNTKVPEFEGWEFLLHRDAVLSVATGTQALGGFLPPQIYGGSRALTLTATSEVQCVDMLSVDKRAYAAKGIAEFVVRLGVNGSTSAVDLNFGLANGTSASDADAIGEYCFFHIDGGDLSVFAQSKDGTTTVAATDTTIDVTAGSAVANRFEFWIDYRDLTNVKLYINGARVLSGTTFKLDAGVGPFGILCHLEKSTGTATAGPVYFDRAQLRTMQQGTSG